ncbi:right-handed parallel beta-helix repeat-containing protein [Lichenihabitans sp. PAMC28606]|uniref:right-handed parallel beta-helix repeat-containing protein n=1 Tax=Lichenihabitans sp. PAMC28606 TaxID=2880932 RepID=UPI001D0A87C2|nr:right-handed parallel beta-helix repeat-containing protein [Lichenihabitans sp. PAMC28606]UDL93799.1 right-handed parallel beta-helix repeat-containing protein [Lichenihabitans sp. PAMC28606]
MRWTHASTTRFGAIATASLLFASATGVGSADTAPIPSDPVPPDVSQAGPRPIHCPSPAVRIEPGQSIQAVVDRQGPGTVFCIAAGRYRAQTIAPKDGQAFYGEAGAVLDGTLPLTDFRQVGNLWSVPSRAPPFEPLAKVSYRRCLTSVPLCEHPEVVWLDDVALVRVETRAALKPGSFLIDDAGRVVIADDPTGHQMSETAARYAFLSNHARDVVVSDLTVQRYGNPPQRGAIFDDQNRGSTGWTIQHNDVRENSGLGILTGPSSRILDNRVDHNGQLGISATLQNGLIDGNEISGNNTRGFDPGWEGGGLKAAVTTNLVIRRNVARRNHGPGLWCDIECRNTLYDNNLVEDNDGAGIFHEISYAATIRNNISRRNGVADQSWYWGANILIAASQDVTVEHNLVVVSEGGTGIALIDQGRPRDNGGLYKTMGNRIEANVVRFTGSKDARMGAVSDVARGSPNDHMIENGHNLFSGNVYVVPPHCEVSFGWGRQTVDLPAFQALGQDVTSTVVTQNGG